MTRVAIVGSGISGLSAAHHLHGHAEVTLFEAGDYFGGHTHTVDVTLPVHATDYIAGTTPRAQPTQTFGVDTGFLVFNERTYPGLIALFEQLQVATCKSDMSFSVQVPHAFGSQALEWNGADLNTVFAQRSNLLRPSFLHMLRDVLRFNTLASELAERQIDHELAQPLQDFLRTHQFGNTFRDWYLLPMLGCIWSCPTDQMLQFPVATMVRFCHNHGLIQVNQRPQWYTVQGGARHYVEKIVAQIDHVHLNTPVLNIERHAHGVTLHTTHGTAAFDHVIVATHANQALRMLQAPSVNEQVVLGAMRTHPNRAVLHTDTSVMPRKKRAWAAWNYERAANDNTESSRVCLHYWLNQLQPLPFAQDVIVSLNPVREINPQQVLGEYEYAHPVFDLSAIHAQTRVPELQGQQRTWFAGAWMGYGFHEDGFKAGRAAAQGVLAAVHKNAGHAAKAHAVTPQQLQGWPCHRSRGASRSTQKRQTCRRSTRRHAAEGGRMTTHNAPFTATALIGEGWIRHARLRPLHHAFSYGTFFVLLPMRSLAAGVPSELPVNRAGWLSFHDVDHGDARSHACGGALQWLDELLQREGIHDAHGEVWLHCFPRVLGYTFKPVSFWYCHASDNSLRAIVVEVNNTFGERHCYLLDRPQWGVEQVAKKVFHVSPFCTLEGRYRFRFMRTFDRETNRTVARIDHDDANGPLIQTSVCGELQPATRAALRRAVWRYPLMTLMVIVRIHWHALHLWRKRVAFFTKPPPPCDFVTR